MSLGFSVNINISKYRFRDCRIPKLPWFEAWTILEANESMVKTAATNLRWSNYSNRNTRSKFWNKGSIFEDSFRHKVVWREFQNGERTIKESRNFINYYNSSNRASLICLEIKGIHIYLEYCKNSAKCGLTWRESTQRTIRNSLDTLIHSSEAIAESTSWSGTWKSQISIVSQGTKIVFQGSHPVTPWKLLTID